MTGKGIAWVGRIVQRPPIREENPGTKIARGGTNGVEFIYELPVDWQALADKLAAALEKCDICAGCAGATGGPCDDTHQCVEATARTAALAEYRKHVPKVVNRLQIVGTSSEKPTE